MTEESVCVRLLTPSEAHEQVPALADILIDCVEGGASVSFMTPLSRDKALAFWWTVAEGVAVGEKALLIARDRTTNSALGTVQILLKQPENQPHRADIAKMLVHRQARRQGIGAMLMRAAEDAARAAGKTLLVLDTVTGSAAERLYQRLGWQRVGEIPGYALWPDGRPCPTTYYYKPLS
jgi:ribosomal protein S18 acetylase RimI-like enzyme